MNIESHLDNVFYSAAKSTLASMQNKLFEYILYSSYHGDVKSKGKCTVDSCRYDRIQDCNIFSFTDVNTGSRYSANQFQVSFKEVS